MNTEYKNFAERVNTETIISNIMDDLADAMVYAMTARRYKRRLAVGGMDANEARDIINIVNSAREHAFVFELKRNGGGCVVEVDGYASYHNTKAANDGFTAVHTIYINADYADEGIVRRLTQWLCDEGFSYAFKREKVELGFGYTYKRSNEAWVDEKGRFAYTPKNGGSWGNR